MKKKQVQLPFNIHNDFITHLLQSRPGVILSNWTTQGMRYMNRHERLHRIILEVFMVSLLSIVFALLLNIYVVAILSFLIIHTLFWIFNGHFYVLMRYISRRQIDPGTFLLYIEDIYERMQTKNFLLAIAAFGSLSKGQFSGACDFDVRLIRRKGFINSLRAFNLCTLERARAFLNGFPLDIYVFDLDEIKDKIKPDEPPIIIFDPDEAINNRFENVIKFDEFRKMYHEILAKQ